MTSDPVEKSSISDSLTTAASVSVGAAGAVDDSSIVLVVVAALGGLEPSSRPSIQTTDRSAVFEAGQLGTYHIETRHR